MRVDPETVWPTLEGARQALEEGDGANVKVAIIDSGIESSHPLLSGMNLADDVVISCDGMNINFEEGSGNDAYGHGTAVAGVLLDEVPAITVGSFRALDTQNRSRSFVIAEAVHLAISRGYQVINCSFGCRGQPKYVMDYKEWVDLAYLNGVQIVAACSNLESGIREWPAYFPSVFGVRAIDCPSEEIYHTPNQMISFMAQGERVKVPWLGGSTKIETGSSFAAPRISGKIAKLLSVYPNLDPGLIKPLLANLAKVYQPRE
ncbi:MAG: S8 family serine peptidase [Verrucomicrobiales bacterium]|nr:S8 family serine peptidase [Verrucomicrobiales bacterium]